MPEALPCSVICLLVCFLSTGNVVATAGLSQRTHRNCYNIAVWDTLMAPDKARVAAFNAHTSKGATSLVYARGSQTLISGGKTGEICVWDMRQQKLLQTVHAHGLNVRSLAIDESEKFLASGSSDGNVKIWSLRDGQLEEMEVFEDLHKQQTFTKNQSKFLSSAISTFGVMCVRFHRQKLYSCGSDGRLLSRAYSVTTDP